MKNHTKKGRMLFFIRIWMFAAGIGFKRSLGFVRNIPKTLSVLSIPMIVIGIALVIVSNFYRKNKDK